MTPSNICHQVPSCIWVDRVLKVDKSLYYYLILDNSQNQLHIDGIPIKRTTITRFLGVVTDEQLSWQPHVAALRQKLAYASATLNRIRDSVPK